MSLNMSLSFKAVATLVFELEKAGITDNEVKDLCEPGRLAEIKALLRGEVQIVPKHRIIDCDAEPSCPEDWKIEEHRKGGQMVFDPQEIIFYRNTNQIEGRELRKELTDKLVLNSNVLDYLLKNPSLIPDSWKEDEYGRPRLIYFWGTIYRHSSGNLVVRALYFNSGSWFCDCKTLLLDFFENEYALIGQVRPWYLSA